MRTEPTHGGHCRATVASIFGQVRCIRADLKITMTKNIAASVVLTSVQRSHHQ